MSDNKPKNDKPPVAIKRPTGLGRGLSSLFGDIQREAPLASNGADGQSGAAVNSPSLRLIAISEIRPNPEQPRQYFDTDALDELAASMKLRGVIQPIVVRPNGKNYQIVAGERRWRAAQRARLHEIPAIVRKLSDAETLEIAIVENVQRRDLNVIEEADAYSKLCAEFGHSASGLAEIVGKSRSHVTNIMRLLELPEAVRQLVGVEALTMGHARALINCDDAEALANEIVERQLSVRDTEKLVRRGKANDSRSEKLPNRSPNETDADIKAVESHLGDLLGLKVSIQAKNNNGAGAMTIVFNNLDQLDLICQRLTGERI